MLGNSISVDSVYKHINPLHVTCVSCASAGFELHGGADAGRRVLVFIGDTRGRDSGEKSGEVGMRWDWEGHRAASQP